MTASESTTPPARKLRILCLHGYRGSADTLRSQLLPLFAGLESLVDLVCLDAPSLAAGDYGWWHPVDVPGGAAGQKLYKGWSRTRDALVEVFQRQGPFDGVFGFSQGAALAGMLVGLRAPDGRPTREHPLVFRFAILVGGYPSTDPSYESLYASRASYALPSLHIVGRADDIISNPRSAALAAHFQSPLVLEHDGGHVIPNTPAIRQGLRGFLEARLREHPAPERPPAGQPLAVPLWPGRPAPVMTLHFPKQPRSRPAPAMLVFRGGGYATNAGSGGGSAEWLAAHGFVGIQVDYRVRNPPESFLAGYADAARALRLVRQNAARWGIDPARVGVMGYSAGGHLASLLSTQPDLKADPADDLMGRVSARPDLVVLSYPVISFVEGYRPGGLASSAENFFGQRALPEELRRRFSNELHVTRAHPPVFVWTTRDDALVPYTQSQRFVEACEAAGVPVTYKLFERGPHGMGLALEQTSDVKTWTALLLEWLEARWGPQALTE